MSEAYKLAIMRREMISSLRKGIVAFAMFALLSTIPAVAWADGTINAEPAANMAPQASQVATWDCSDAVSYTHLTLPTT